MKLCWLHCILETMDLVIFYCRKLVELVFISLGFKFNVVVDSIWVRRQHGVYLEPAIQGSGSEARGA